MDEIDEATEVVQRRIDEGIARAREKPLDPGRPGECFFCGNFSPRLILGACARCRDERGLP